MKKRPYLVDIVVGTRPNIVKAGPLFRALREANWCLPRLVYLAQHTATAMTTDTFSDVGIPQEEVHRLDLSAVGFGARMGEMVQKYSDHLTKSPPAVVLVLGDVDSTFAAAYAAKRMHVPVAHIEAGLRSGDLSMPEELNRRMVDTISDLLLTTTEGACTNLRLEGRSESEIHFTGNLMIDSLRRTLADPLLDDRVCVLKEQYRLTDSDYILATFHRPSNVDAPNHIQHVTTVLQAAAKRLPVIFPVHPRSRHALERHGIQVPSSVHLLPPLRYRDFIALLSSARLAITDSGGLQEETSVLGIPCLTFRPNTERPETVSLGTNTLVGPEEAVGAIDRALAGTSRAPATIPGWDGHAAPRIARVLRSWLDGRSCQRT